MMTNKENVCLSVKFFPYQTANWHNVRSGRRVRCSWAYAAFERAFRAGLIDRVWLKGKTGLLGRTTYVITPIGEKYLKDCGY